MSHALKEGKALRVKATKTADEKRMRDVFRQVESYDEREIPYPPELVDMINAIPGDWEYVQQLGERLGFLHDVTRIIWGRYKPPLLLAAGGRMITAEA